MMRRTAKTVQSFLEEPEFILGISGISDRRSNDHTFIIWKVGLAEGILAVSLLKDTLIADSLGSEEAKGAVFEDWGIALGLAVVVVFVVAEDDDAGLRAVQVAILDGLDDEDAHGGERLRDFPSSAQPQVVLFTDPFVNVERL